jgi:hypothetical protein
MQCGTKNVFPDETTSCVLKIFDVVIPTLYYACRQHSKTPMRKTTHDESTLIMAFEEPLKLYIIIGENLRSLKLLLGGQHPCK